MKRPRIVVATGVIAAATLASIAVDPPPRLIWNASASVPIGLYAVRAIDRPAPGELVAVRPPDDLSLYLARRHYLPLGVALLKHVAAVPGQTVCRFGNSIVVDGAPVALALDADSRDRPLPRWSGCRTLTEGWVFMLNPSVRDSMDGRYFGPLPASTIIGRATPLWADPPANPAPPPQPKES